MQPLTDELIEIESGSPARIAAATTLEELDQLEAELVGRRSRLADARRSLGTMEETERPRLGQLINRVAAELTAHIDERRRELSAGELDGVLAAERVDVTLPGRPPPRGSHHVISTTMDEIVDVFVSIGYTVATGPEAETEWYNFTALNMPPTHPARTEQDSLYLEYGDAPEGVVLRTQTSPMQIRYLETHEPPVYLVSPGRVFRRDALDPTHSPVFHQVEGLAVADDITFPHLKGTLAYFAHEFFGADLPVRFLPSHFPFTEPSAEMYVGCFACRGSGCRVCSGSGWLEVLGCGMVHPAVLEAAGCDPARFTGFAFGMGVDRMAMIRHGINDIRYLFDPDLRVLEQFR